MVIPFVALIGATAALCAILFKEKDSKINEIIEFERIPEEKIKKSPQLQLVKDELNAHITGVTDREFHPFLLKIMVAENKPIGYFSRVDGKLIIEIDRIKIKNRNFFSLSFLKEYIKEKYNTASNLSIFITFYLTVYFLIAPPQDEAYPSIAAMQLILTVIAGFLLYNWLMIISKIWKEKANGKDILEYKEIFDKYPLDN
ncbi:hypothetical protein V462_19485 [Pantoea ananatis 15320]|uniref:hypothetical protein n=1 Tax=Pantoea ananas TaxID=553 RepID=UPI000CF4BCE2|nr:hypothetical protein [Pantoea ananatis]PKC30679.1 hypothetical protein V462_19485 [Pantoea ananatis 15320]PQK79116.1 hypothetical protein CG428_05660 [Pantoea ananatis]